MNWRLVCCECARGLETKTPGILVHPDLTCAVCGVRIRTHEGDSKSRFEVLTPSEVERIRASFTPAPLRSWEAAKHAEGPAGKRYCGTCGWLAPLEIKVEASRTADLRAVYYQCPQCRGWLKVRRVEQEK